MSYEQNRRIVAIDSMTLIWGVRRDGPQDDIKHARILFDELEHNKAIIIVPAIVVAEYLTAIKPSDMEKTAIEIGKLFHIAPFDVRDAVLAAKLYKDGKSKRNLNKPGTRICLRADTFIVATAKNHGALEFYTDDKDCLEMAKRAGLQAKNLPKHSGYLPGMEDIHQIEPKPKKT